MNAKGRKKQDETPAVDLLASAEQQYTAAVSEAVKRLAAGADWANELLQLELSLPGLKAERLDLLAGNDQVQAGRLGEEIARRVQRADDLHQLIEKRRALAPELAETLYDQEGAAVKAARLAAAAAAVGPLREQAAKLEQQLKQVVQALATRERDWYVASAEVEQHGWANLRRQGIARLVAQLLGEPEPTEPMPAVLSLQQGVDVTSAIDAQRRERYTPPPAPEVHVAAPPLPRDPMAPPVELGAVAEIRARLKREGLAALAAEAQVRGDVEELPYDLAADA